MHKILITGSNGLIGQQLISICVQKYPNTSIIATSKSPSLVTYPKAIQFELLDITNIAELKYIIQLHSPDIIINTAAITNADYCESNIEECWQTNVTAVEYLTEICTQLGIYLCHFSTDFVFDGIEGIYPETAQPSALSLYGKSKAESERIVQESTCKWSIIRTSLVYGAVKNQRKSNLLNWVVQSLRNEKSISVVSDQYRTPTYVHDLVQACLELSIHKHEGIFNIAGSEVYSVYEIAQEIARVFGENEKLISECSTQSLHEKARRPIKTYLPIHKSEQQIHYMPHSLYEGLTAIKKMNII